jgi:tetratricopeptide (TPR) repeat protein
LRAATHAAWLRHADTWLSPHARAAHAWAADDKARAVQASREAATQDAQRGLHDAALALVAHALARLPAQDPARAGLHAQRAQLWLQQARLDDARAEAERALAELPDPPDRALALTVQADAALQQGRLADVPALLDAALQTQPDHAGAWMLRVRWMHAQGDYAQAEAVLRERLAQLRQTRPGPDLVAALTSLAANIDFLGRHAEALPLHREALATAQRLGVRYGEVEAVVNLLWCLPEMGLHEEAIAIGERTLALGEYDATPTLANNLAWLYLQRGRPDDAARLYTRLLDAADSTLVCVAQAKLLQIHAEQRRGELAEAAAQALLQRMSLTDHAQAHAIGVLALLDHGPAPLRGQALAHLPKVRVDSELQARLDAAVARANAGRSPD